MSLQDYLSFAAAGHVLIVFHVMTKLFPFKGNLVETIKQKALFGFLIFGCFLLQLLITLCHSAAGEEKKNVSAQQQQQSRYYLTSTIAISF